MGFSFIQQHLLSFLNVKKVAPLNSVLKILEEFLSASGSDTTLANERLFEEISKINKTIQKYNLEIVELTDEITCEKLFILISTGDITSNKSLFYSESTTHFFSKIVKECVFSEEGSLSETHCLNLNTQAKITKSEAQCILEKLIKEKWLDSTNNKISLGMRSIAELGQSIKQHYPNDVKNCPFCKVMVLQGFICPNCRIKTHNACCKKYFKLSKTNFICPSCKESWRNVSPYKEFKEIEDSPQEERNDDFIRPSFKKKKKIK